MPMLIGVAAMLSALIATIVFEAQPATANFPSRNDQIVFTSTRDGSGVWRLYRMDADGTNQVRVTSNNATEEYPVFSPDGSKIAFAAKLDGSGYDHVYTMNVDGSNQTRLTDGGNNLDYMPAWSPDGSKIAYVEWSGGSNYDILKMNADGSSKTVLINTSAVEDRPAWSADGSKIVFETNTNGKYDIYKMDAGGQNVTRLTTSSADDKFPSFSPDGSKIVFASNRDGNFEVYKMDADGQNQTRITNNSATDYLPRYSPLGDRIVFARTISGFDQIFTMDPGGSNVTQLTNSVRTNTQPSWGPDTQAPALSIDSGPSGPTNNTRPAFGFSSDDAAASYSCSIDTGTPGFGPCSGTSSDQPPSDLADGDYTFRIKATDPSGNSTTRTRTFTVDLQPPSVSVQPDPGDFDASETTTNAQPTFHFSTGDGSDTFQCSIDTGTANFGPCSGQGSHRPQSPLSDETYSFRVKATDLAGNSTIGVSTFSVRPDTYITSGPSGPTNLSAPTFTYASTVSGTTFECRIDSSSFSPCSQDGYVSSALSDGSHTFAVRATGPHGHTDQTPATSDFTVDTQPPGLSFDYGPSGLVNSPRPVFGFSTDDATATVTCALDGGDFGPCTTDNTYRPDPPLGNGSHTLDVKATDPAGNWTRVERHFEVENTAPGYANTLVYERDATSENDGNIWVSRDGGETADVLPIWGWNPALSPDGRRIVYGNWGGVYVTDIGGHFSPQAVPTSGCDFTRAQWEPDGHGIILGDCGSPDGYMNVYEARDLGDNWQRTALIDWPGPQFEPSMSPDGSKIVFLSDTTPSGDPVDGYYGSIPAVFIADAGGSHPHQLTTPYPADPNEDPGPENFTPFMSFGSTPSFSKDGQEVLVSGWRGDIDDPEVYEIDVSDGTIHRLTNLPGDEYYPRYLPDGRIVFLSTDPQGSSYQYYRMNADGSHLQAISPQSSDYSGPISGVTPSIPHQVTADNVDSYLTDYAPTLKYDDGEDWRAVDPAAALRIYSGSSPEESNLIESQDGTVIAYSNPALSPDPLRLSFLTGGGNSYPNGVVADAGDRLVERSTGNGDNTRLNDAAEMQLNPDSRDMAMGRTVFDEGHWWLQYWFYYYYDAGDPLVGIGDHAGDWEMIQVRLDDYGQPQEATYAEHDTGQTCLWTELNWTLGKYDNVSPMVYVASGKHASYTRTGTALGPANTDIADGDGYAAHVRVNPTSDSEGWMQWPGLWGLNGPPGPLYQGDKSDHPQAFADARGACQADPESGVSTARALTRSSRGGTPKRPPVPTITAHRLGRQMIIHYRWRRHARPKPIGLKVAVDARRAIVIPSTKEARRERGHGTVRVPLPDGKGPYTVVAQTAARSRILSREAKVRVSTNHHGRPRHKARSSSTWTPPPLRIHVTSEGGTFGAAMEALRTDPQRALAIALSHRTASQRWAQILSLARQQVLQQAEYRRLRQAPRPTLPVHRK